MDGRNNQHNPQNTQNNQLTNASSAELNHILQNGVTPEQFAENARQLEAYSRMNAMGLQVYLQREAQLAERRRQDELRLIQMAQQLASGTQQQQFQRRILPPVPQMTHGHQPLPAQQAVATSTVNNRNVPTQTHNHGPPYNRAHTSNIPSQHGQYYRPRVEPSRAPLPNVQHQQAHLPLNGSAHAVNQNVYHQRETVRISHSVGGGGPVAIPTLPTPQTAQTTSAFIPQKPQYPQYSGTATSSQAIPGQGGASGVTADHGVRHLYPSWVKAYGAERAASMAREALQWRGQARQMVPTPMQPTVTSSAASASAPDPRSQSQFQIPKQDILEVGTAQHHPHPQSQEWSPVAPLVPSDGQQAPSQSRPAVPSSHVTHMHSTTDGSTHETGAREFVGRPGGNPDVPNSIEAQPQNLGVTASNPAVMSINLGSSSSTPPSLQQGPAQSILLASEEKSTALYSMRGLAASIKRSLNAERLAASAEPSATSDLHKQKRMRSTSAEIIDCPDPKVVKRSDSAEAYEQVTLLTTETQPVSHVNERNASPPAMLPSFPQVSTQQQETVPPGGFNANPQHESTPNFVPFSTLAGAVSFDNITESAPASHNVHSAEPTGHLEDLASSQPTPDILLHGPMNIPLVPVSQSPFNPLSFPHRTPTPPLAATITPLHDDDEVDEKAEEHNSSRPTSLSHIEEADTEVLLIPSANEDDHEMSVASGEDQVRNSLSVASLSEYATDPGAWDKKLPAQEADVFIRRTGLLDSSTGEISGEVTKNLQTEEHPAGEARSPVSPVRTTEELPVVLARKSPTRVKSPGATETTGSGPLSKVPSKSGRKQAFYIDVPPPSEWVLRAKRREAEKKALISDKTEQRSSREYADCETLDRLCPRRCHWSGCQAILNSIYTLKQHVRRHQSEVEPVGPAMTVSCQWKQCRMVCEQSSLLRHLERHIEKETICIYDDCDERFSRIQDLEAHEKSSHVNDEPPPCAIPRPPELKSLPVLPQTLPSYTTTTRLASKPSITEDRHARLGPWVLGMTFGYPTLGPDGELFNSASRVRRATRLADKAIDMVSTPTFPGLGESGEMTPNSEFLGQSAEYDLSEEPMVATTRIFSDLDTVEVTQLFCDGVRERSPGDDGVETSSETGVDTDCLAVEALL